MDFNLTLCIIFFVLMFFAVPIVCYIMCPKDILRRLRHILLALYVVILFIGVTAHITIDGNILHVDYAFVKEWGDKDMFWGFDNLTFVDVALNLLMLIPIGAYIASSDKHRKVVHTILIACLVGMIISLSIETLQYILPVDRTVQFSDTVFNTISAGLGAGMILIFSRLRSKMQKIIEQKQTTEQNQNIQQNDNK